MKTLKQLFTFIFLVLCNFCFSQTYHVKPGSAINLRSGQGKSNSVVSSIKPNSQVRVISKDGDWWKVEYNGVTGYVKSEFLIETKSTETNKETHTSPPTRVEHTEVRKTEPIRNHQQEKSNGNTSFNENSKLINVGIGLFSQGYYSYNFGNYSSTPVISLSYEQALKEKVGPGYIGVGGYFAFQSASYRYEYYNNYKFTGNQLYYNEYNWNYYMIAARAAYHWDELNKDKYDIYGGLSLGLRIQTFSYKSNDTYYLQPNQGSTFAIISPFIGGRYYLTNKIALFGETGYGISYLTLGATLKL